MRSIARQNKDLEIFLTLISVFSLTVFIFIGWPFDYYFQNDEFGHLPLAMKGKFIVNSLPRPLATFTLYCDYKIWGLQPFGYHITNLALHVVNCGLVYHFSFLIQSNEENVNRRKIKAYVASLIFLFYGFHSETIFWISGRGGSLAAFFALLSLIFYLKRPKSNWNIL